MKATSRFFAEMLFSVCSVHSQAQDPVPAAVPTMVEISTAGETKALIAAINSFQI